MDVKHRQASHGAYGNGQVLREQDGLPNTWEVRKGLDPKNAVDGAADPDGDGYTNLEDYLNWLAAGSPQDKEDT